MKRRVLKKKMKRILNGELSAMIKLSVMQELIKLSQRSSWFQFEDYPYVRFERFSTSSNKGYVTVLERDCVDGICFVSWYKGLAWICKQAKRVGECEVKGSEYIVDSGHYRYTIYFPKNQE